jgi:hypothetical protein
MNEIRAKFEEIWPVPAGIEWNDAVGGYRPLRYTDATVSTCGEYIARLDTFTRCQETTDVYVSLIDDMILEIEGLSIAAYGCVTQQSQDIVDRANKILGRE